MGIVVEADWDGKHVVAKIPYALLEKSRIIKEEVGGGFWKKDKSWHYNPSLDTCYALRREFGSDLEITKRLAEWARTEIAREKQLASIAAQPDADVPWLAQHAPTLAATLRPDQRVAAAFLALARRALLADQPGLGKTLETLAAFMNVEDPSGAYLVICPRLSVAEVWLPEIRRWLPEVAVYSTRGKWAGKNISTKAHRQAVIDAFQDDESPVKFLLVNHEMLRIKSTEIDAPSFDNDWKGKYKDDADYPDLFTVQWRGLAVDESHKAFGSLSTPQSGKGNMAGRGLRKLRSECVREDGAVYAVTGTPYGRGGRVQGMFGTLHWLEPEKYTSFWRWAERWLIVEEGEYGMKVLGLKMGDENVEQFYDALGPVLIRRTKREVLLNLPPKEYREVRCEMVGEQKRQYLEFAKNGTVQLKSGAEIVAGGTLAEYMRKRQLANGAIDVAHDGTVYFPEGCDSGKIDRLWQMMEERGIFDGSGDVKMIVASQFEKFTDVIHKRLVLGNVDHHYLTGKVSSDSKRTEMREAFQGTGGARVFLMTSQTGGVSITLDAADEVHCLDEMWNPEENEQLEDRAHRASRMHQVTIYYYRSEGTVDTYIAETVDEKAREQHAALDAKRGVEFLRNILAESDQRTKEEVK